MYVNASKTKHIGFDQQGIIQTTSGEPIKAVEPFTYLGSEINSTKQDVKICIAKAWATLNKMDIVWKSELSKDLKCRFFHTTVESIMMYGATAWTLTKSLELKLDGTYTRMMKAFLNICWSFLIC